MATIKYYSKRVLAFNRCVEKGANIIICHPYFLSYGKHVTEDIPRLMQEASLQHPHVKYFITNPLGTNDRVVNLIEDTIAVTMEKLGPLR